MTMYFRSVTFVGEPLNHIRQNTEISPINRSVRSRVDVPIRHAQSRLRTHSFPCSIESMEHTRQPITNDVISFLVERRIREDRLTMNALRLHRLNVDNHDEGKEFEFWTKLRKARLLPESKAFGQHSELSEKLADLRDSVVLFITVANLLWIILIMSLAAKVNLNVAGTNPLGLSFLVVFGVLIVLQFLTMLWHRLSTLLHLIARAPFRAGRTSVKVWSFDDSDLPPAPTEEQLARIRMKITRNSLRRRHNSRGELSQSYEDFGNGDERQPLLRNDRKQNRPLSPLPV